MTEFAPGTIFLVSLQTCWMRTIQTWLPTLNLGHRNSLSESTARAAEERWERMKEREARRNTEVVSDTVTAEVVSESGDGQACLVDAGVQTSLTSKSIDESIDYFHGKMSSLIKEMNRLKDMRPFTEEALMDSNDNVKFYTGLPSFNVLKTVFKFVDPPATTSTKLSSFQEFVLTLMKLRLDSPLKDLAYRFRISVTTVSRIFAKWLVILDVRLSSCLIRWPDRDSLWKTMPQCFRVSFKKSVAVIVDCFEVFIERPSSLLARASTWSSYKHHNTIKVILGITPQGTISYVSEAWGEE